jgi:hypothetical protein
MEKPPDKVPIKNLRDAYKVPGFHVRAKLDSHELGGYGVGVLTLDRRSKKACVADAEKPAAAFMTNAGGARATSVAATGKSISTFKCAASIAKPAA